MSLLQEIVNWSAGLPAWQSDALRRLFSQGTLTSKDEAEILAMAKAHHKLVPPEAAPAPIPLQSSHLPTSSAAANPTLLLTMQDVKNVNALAPGHKISFTPKGLTIIYGGNGTGKSGYARVLKRACRARDGGGAILPNIHGAGPHNPPEASFIIGAEPPVPVKWKEGDATPPELAEIAVLDSNCSRLFIDEAAVISYAPYGLDVFPKLGRLLTSLKASLEAERERLNCRDSILDELSGPTSVGILISTLSAKTAKDEIEKLAALSVTEQNRLEELEKRIAELKANDPTKEAEILRRLRRRVAVCKTQIEADSGVLGASRIEKIWSVWQVADLAEKAAQEASSHTFDKEPLAGAGSNPWKEMFRYAVQYSALAYPDKEFPFTGDGSRCVLCQQPLTDDAKSRLARFWAFIVDKTAQEAQRTRKEADALIESLKAARPFSPEQELLQEIKERNPGLVTLLEKHPARFREEAKSVLGSIISGALPGSVSGFSDTLASLGALDAALEETINQKVLLAKPEEMAKCVAEYEELAARRKLGKYKDVVLAQVSRLVDISKYGDCIASLKTTEVSRKGKELTEKSLTKTLQDALAEELKRVGMNNVPLDFKQSASQGQTRHQLQVPNAKAPKNTPLSEILSEGEQHVIAFAAFLAELRVSGLKNAVVFDDPVSSLDHRWMERVASRLVEEAKERQVIVFTHNVSFVVGLTKEATAQSVMVHAEWLRRFDNVPGHCSPEFPWEVLSASKRLKVLTDICAEAKKVYASDPEGEEYQKVHDRFYDRLRATWERSVEELLLNAVVLRFRNGVETRRLSRVVIDDEDFAIIYSAMSKSSEETPAHDHASGLHHELPSPDDMQKEIEKLKEYMDQLKKKQDVVDSRRSATTKPKTGS